mmetsp:Transcript_30149/g.92230  ORF Transcript_30149/g.92230 Transcript_30149/m.92230 type:complete len:225 (+) Transcript_30149:48-722(+)
MVWPRSARRRVVPGVGGHSSGARLRESDRGVTEERRRGLESEGSDGARGDRHRLADKSRRCVPRVSGELRCRFSPSHMGQLARCPLRRRLRLRRGLLLAGDGTRSALGLHQMLRSLALRPLLPRLGRLREWLGRPRLQQLQPPRLSLGHGHRIVRRRRRRRAVRRKDDPSRDQGESPGALRQLLARCRKTTPRPPPRRESLLDETRHLPRRGRPPSPLGISLRR